MKTFNPQEKPNNAKGLYIALVIGAIVIGGAGIFGVASLFAAQNAPEPYNDDQIVDDYGIPGDDYDSIFDDTGGDDDVMKPGIDDQTTGDNVPVQAVQTTTPTTTPPPKKLNVFYKPVSGRIIKSHSPDELVFSSTFNDWRVHSGVDIEASAGAKVVALTDGVVENVYKDEMMGMCVVIKHDGGLKSIYANLMDNVPVKKGQSVKAGETIGGVGNTAWVEVADKPHLHFEVLKDGKQQDPEKYFPK